NSESSGSGNSPLSPLLGRQCAAAGFSEADMAQSLHELVTVNPGVVQSFEPKMTGGLCRKWPKGTEPDVLVIRSICRPTISNRQTLIMIEGQSVEEVNSSSLDEFIVAEVWAGTLQFIVSASLTLRYSADLNACECWL
ncbi:hypothetical protein, partial [Komagataeibacter intermedius]|uniref:hypothetical protein n=1 Tax=Komagataeibacter intermedius TaxID=66229 RepID=UPI001AE01C12